jgi:tripartite-type tricarboxylate transporter receptor subunit TctC
MWQRHVEDIMIKSASALILAATCAVAATSRAHAQTDYPNTAVKVIVANTAGSASDNLIRIIGARLSVMLGQQFLVINQAGAGGTIGSEMVARAPADGYTLFVTSTQAQSISPHLYPNAKYKPLEDFAAITMLAKTENVLVVASEQPMKSVAELVAHAKANPGKLDMANAGPGSQSHLAGSMFATAAGIEVLHIPYKGAASVIAVMGNQSHLTFAPLPAVVAGIQSGKLRALAIGGTTRSMILPELPTVDEAGINGFNSSGWSGLVAPKGLPAAIVDKLRANITTVIGEPAIKDSLIKAGGEPWMTTPEEMMAAMTDDLQRYGEAVKATGVKVE